MVLFKYKNYRSNAARYFPGLIFLLLIFSILNLNCSKDPLKKYKPSVLKWEEDIQKLEELDRTESYPDNAILFVGSSSIRRWDTIQEDMSPYPVIKRGYGGAKLSDLAWYAERIIYPHQFKALVIFVANDIAGRDEDKTPEEILFLFKHIVKTVSKKFPEKPVLFIEITPTPKRWSVWSQASRANDLIQGYCEKEHNLHFISTRNYFIGSNGLPRPEMFVEDRLHLNRIGYGQWAEIIKTKLDSVLSM